MAHGSSIFVALALAAQFINPAGAPLMGVVEVPRVTGTYAEDGTAVPPNPTRPVDLRREPADSSPVAASVTSIDQLETVEYTSEERAAIVYGREGEWSRVRTSGGIDAWLSPRDAGEFHSLEELLRNSHAYLTEAWDGALFAQPGGSEPVVIPDDPQRKMVGYVEPVVQQYRVVLRPDQDPEVVRKAFNVSGMGSGPGPDGTRIYYFEIGTVIPVFAEPNIQGPIATHIQTDRAQGLRGTGQSPPQVIVFENRGGWYQVAETNDGEWRTARRRWLQVSPLWRFHPVKSDAEMAALAERAFGPESRDAKVMGFRIVDGVLWVDVELVYVTECSGAEVPRVRGWVPAHARSGALNVWYYARGC
jgi:hypothetical protein